MMNFNYSNGKGYASTLNARNYDRLDRDKLILPAINHQTTPLTAVPVQQANYTPLINNNFANDYRSIGHDPNLLLSFLLPQLIQQQQRGTQFFQQPSFQQRDIFSMNPSNQYQPSNYNPIMPFPNPWNMAPLNSMDKPETTTSKMSASTQFVYKKDLSPRDTYKEIRTRDLHTNLKGLPPNTWSLDYKIAKDKQDRRINYSKNLKRLHVSNY